MTIKGFFVDWNGDTRRTENPGPGYTCQVDLERNYVDVIDGGGFVIFESSYFPTLESVATADIETKLIEFPLVAERESPVIDVSSADGIVLENCVFVATPKSATVPDSGDTSPQQLG